MYILDTNLTVFIRYIIWKYFLLVFHSWSCHSLNNIFLQIKAFRFDKVQHAGVFPFMTHAFAVSKSSLPNRGHADFLLEVLYSFIFIIRSMIHFELIFANDVRYRYRNFFSYGLPNFSAPLVNKTIHFPLNFFASISKISLFVWVYFWTLFYSICLHVSFHHYHTVLITVAL